jgi:hypothetical protein
LHRSTNSLTRENAGEAFFIGSFDMRAREITIKGNVAYIPLSKGLKAIIDASDIEKVHGWNWHAVKSRSTVYARRTDCSVKPPKAIHLHRVIMSPYLDSEVDHINGDGLDNRKANLRVVTSNQNRLNKFMNKKNTSGYKGASKFRNKWKAQIQTSGKRIYLGLYNTAEEAHHAYCNAAKTMHGNFWNPGIQKNIEIGRAM